MFGLYNILAGTMTSLILPMIIYGLSHLQKSFVMYLTELAKRWNCFCYIYVIVNENCFF